MKHLLDVLYTSTEDVEDIQEMADELATVLEELEIGPRESSPVVVNSLGMVVFLN